jgi:hypothetical protein
MSRPHLPDRSLANDDEAVLARRRHYGGFYGYEPLPTGYGVVIGNCQAESLRIVLDAPDRPTVRVPAVHELSASDAQRLHRVLAGAAYLVSQPIRDDFHDLPLGTRQLARALGPTARTVVVPSVRFAGLHPFQAALRVPGLAEDPPLVAYHDVRVLARAGGLPLPSWLGRDAVRAIADDTLASLASREQNADVRASDLFAHPDFDLMRTVNHPGNPIWMALGERVLDALGAPGAPTDPGRPLLAAVQAPREDWVVEAWESAATPMNAWSVAGETVAAERVVEAHAEWYRTHPAFVEAALPRLAPLIERWRAA